VSDSRAGNGGAWYCNERRVSKNGAAMVFSLMALSMVFVCLGNTANAQQQNFHSPEGLAISPDQHLWIANYDGDTVVELQGPFTSKTQLPKAITTINTGKGSGPSRLAFDRAGNLYVANSKGNTVTVYQNRG
jgi:DNA-binding beta-propeller fold protein YncE